MSVSFVWFAQLSGVSWKSNILIKAVRDDAWGVKLNVWTEGDSNTGIWCQWETKGIGMICQENKKVGEKIGRDIQWVRTIRKMMH